MASYDQRDHSIVLIVDFEHDFGACKYDFQFQSLSLKSVKKDEFCDNKEAHCFKVNACKHNCVKVK